MDISFYLSLIVNFFIAIVIYNLIKSYKSKVYNKSFDEFKEKFHSIIETQNNNIEILKAEIYLKEKNILLKIKGVSGENLYIDNDEFFKLLQKKLQEFLPNKSPIEINNIIIEYYTRKLT